MTRVNEQSSALEDLHNSEVVFLRNDIVKNYYYRSIGLAGRVFTIGLGDWILIPG